MNLDPQTIVQLVFAAVLLPAGAGWLLGRWMPRIACTLAVGVVGGIVGAVLVGVQPGIAVAAWCAGVAYFASGPGFVPASLEDAGRLVKESPRRWWR